MNNRFNYAVKSLLNMHKSMVGHNKKAIFLKFRHEDNLSLFAKNPSCYEIQNLNIFYSIHERKATASPYKAENTILHSILSSVFEYFRFRHHQLNFFEKCGRSLIFHVFASLLTSLSHWSSGKQFFHGFPILPYTPVI